MTILAEGTIYKQTLIKSKCQNSNLKIKVKAEVEVKSKRIISKP